MQKQRTRHPCFCLLGNMLLTVTGFWEAVDWVIWSHDSTLFPPPPSSGPALFSCPSIWGRSLPLPLTSWWCHYIIVVMSSCNMQQQRRIMGLFFKTPPNRKTLPVPSWPVAMAILLLSSVDTMTCRLRSLCWSAGPKQGPPMTWPETV